jgi:beta-N-acetylhexosaminidase
MLDLNGTELSAEEIELLQHPMTGGVIFFSRNYESVAQITELTRHIRQISGQDILISVDHEGGRVQRFRSEFTELPAVANLGRIYQDNSAEAQLLARKAGWLMAAEVRAVGIDFSFAPVLDLDYGVSQVIGDRAFHRAPDIVATLANAYIKGMKDAGMASTGKHFPGHGAVTADSHLDIPIDTRSKADIWQDDIIPFAQLAKRGLDAVMPAHVIYEQLDKHPAGFSPYWLQDVLRRELDFDGVIFSDDLSMEGATVVGGYTERAEAAMDAGCDMILVCNARAGAIEVLDKANIQATKTSMQRLERMRGEPFVNRSALLQQSKWHDYVTDVCAIA